MYRRDQVDSNLLLTTRAGSRTYVSLSSRGVAPIARRHILPGVDGLELINNDLPPEPHSTYTEIHVVQRLLERLRSGLLPV